MAKKIPDSRAMEKITSDLERLLKGKDFNSKEELNEFLKGIVNKGKIPETSSKSVIAIAQDIMYDAWDTDDRKERIKMAHKALSISPDCADAYVLLAEEDARTVVEAKNLYLKGVEAGRRALGEKIFRKDSGYFWGMVNTRPYMRARAGLLECLWEMGQHDEAITHCREMLSLNPNDNQGIRYTLASYLAILGRFDDLEELLNQGKYKDDCGAEWLYTRPLLSFVKNGDSPQARAELKIALKENSFVPKYITGEKQVPRILPNMFTPGEEDEAIIYAANFLLSWKKVAGAIGWLKNQAGIKITPKIGRNDPCPCGSGKKYKKCCEKLNQ